MSWATDNLRPASFRGVAFEVDATERSSGRRVEISEFAKRDKPALEEFGLRARRLQIDAVLVGDDVIAQARRLEDALNQPGNGTLVHPWYGEITVQIVDEVRTRTVANQGRVARISFTAVESDKSSVYPTTRIDQASKVSSYRTSALDRLSRDFSRGYSMAKAPDWASGIVAGRIQSLAPALYTAASQSGLLDGPAAAVLSAVSRLSAYTGIDVLQGAGLASSLLDQLGSLRGYGSRSSSAYSLLTSWSPSSSLIGTGTPSRQQASAAAASIGSFVPVAAAIEAGASGPDIAWSNSDAAIAWRDQTVDQLADAADLAGAEGWDDTYREIGNLRLAVVRDVNERAAPLPRLSTKQLGRTMPSTLAAYQLDGDGLDTLVTRANDLVERNNVSHPGFVPGGRDLEILS